MRSRLFQFAVFAQRWSRILASNITAIILNSSNTYDVINGDTEDDEEDDDDDNDDDDGDDAVDEDDADDDNDDVMMILVMMMMIMMFIYDDGDGYFTSFISLGHITCKQALRNFTTMEAIQISPIFASRCCSRE